MYKTALRAKCSGLIFSLILRPFLLVVLIRPTLLESIPEQLSERFEYFFSDSHR